MGGLHSNILEMKSCFFFLFRYGKKALANLTDPVTVVGLVTPDVTMVSDVCTVFGVLSLCEEFADFLN